MGDDIQAIKAGILEIADILVVNKADLPGADKTVKALKGMLGLAHPIRKEFMTHGLSQPVPDGENEGTRMWVPPVQRTIALGGDGLPELAGAIEKHAAYLHASGAWSRRERLRLEFELDAMISETLSAQFRRRVGADGYARMVDGLVERRFSPGEALKALLEEKD
jgi:LAO/AO transport system kinase